jgi:DNA (cytosine-5)-methyltransferase 1
MKVVSLFNGMSCLYMALEKVGIPVTKYYSSEIDKYANIATNALFPDTIHLGDVRNIDGTKLTNIDILGGGSPCQSFSFAGKRKGMATKDEVEILSLDQYMELKEQGFEFEGQSYLFWEFVRLLHEIKPRYFLLENVIMEQKWERVISKALGINPIRINANLVSAQNRDRLFWTNIGAEPVGLFGDIQCTIPQPKDRGILLRDIIELDVDEKYYLSDRMLQSLNNPHPQFNGRFVPHDMFTKKTNTLTARYHKMGATDPYFKEICVAMRGRNPDNPKSRVSGLKTEQRLEPRSDGKTNTLTSVQKDNLVLGLTDRQAQNLKMPHEKANSFLSTSYKGSQANGMTLVPVLGCDYRKDEGVRIRKGGKSGTLAARARNDESCGQMVIIPEANNGRVGGVSINKRGIRFHRGDAKKTGISELGTIVTTDQKSDSHLTNHVQKIIIPEATKKGYAEHYDRNYRIRRLTPRECGRLQSVPEKHIDTMLNCGISDTQLYKMFGNGWNVDVIEHIASYIKI